MPTDPPPADLSETIRDVLRSDELTASDLRRPTLGYRAGRPRVTTRALVGGAAAAVVLIAVVVSAVGSDHNSGGPSTAGRASALAGVIGYRWDVTRVHDQAGEVSVPASLGAEIRFTRDGYVLGDDGVNGLQGRYRENSDGYRVDDPVSTTVGSLNQAPDRKRITEAVDAMFIPVANSLDTTPPPAEVIAEVSGTSLTLRRSGKVLTLRRAGAQADVASATPSTTAGPTDSSGTSESGGLGTIAGRLVEVGVPYGVPPRGLDGKVTITNDATHHHRSVTVGRSGRFSVTVPSGDYTLVGRSPQYRANGAGGVCAGDVHVTAGKANLAKVICSVR